LVIYGASAAHGADSNGDFSLMGAGIEKCEAYVKARDDGLDVQRQYISWMSGFFSGMNASTSNVFDVVPWQSPQTFADAAYSNCKRYPNEYFGRIVLGLAKSLEPLWLRSNSDKVIFPGDGATEPPIYRTVLLRVQERLVRLGHDGVTTSGEPDNATREALRAFQRAEGLEPTGLPDQATLARLLLVPS
jgi:hypothetical protein